MRFAVITDTYAPDVNGVALTLERLASGLRRRDHEVFVIAPEPAGRHGGDESAHRVFSLPLPGYPQLRLGVPAPGEVEGLLREFQPHAVYVATETALGYSAIKAADRLGIRVISGFHTNFDGYAASYRAPMFREMARNWLRYFHNLTELTLTPSEESAQRLHEMGIGAVGILGRGVDTELFHPSRRSEQLRSSWGAGAEDPVVLCVCRMAAEKNLALAARTMGRLQELNPSVKGVFVGEGPKLEETRRLWPEFRYAGTRRGEDLAAHYASADVFLFPSLSETYGNVVPEALASGVPVCGFHYAAAKLVKEGESGWLAPYGDESAFLLAAERALNSADGGIMAAPGRSIVRQAVAGLDWEGVTTDFELYLTAGARLPRVRNAS